MAKQLECRCQDGKLFQCFCYCCLNCEGNIGKVKGKYREQARENIKRRQGNRRNGPERKKDVEEGNVKEG